MTTVTTKRCFRCMAGEPVAAFATTDSLATPLRVSAEVVEALSNGQSGICVPCVALREIPVMKVWRNRFAGLLTEYDYRWAVMFALTEGVVPSHA